MSASSLHIESTDSMIDEYHTLLSNIVLTVAGNED